MKLQEMLVRLAVMKAIADRAGKETNRLKELVKAEVGGRMGATAAILPDGSEGATVSITKPTKHKGGELVVTDRAAFTQWCIENRPDAIQQTVRGTSETAILAAARKTGELPDGVGVTEAYESGGGSVTVRQTDEQLTSLIQAWVGGDLSTLRVELLDGGDDAEPA